MTRKIPSYVQTFIGIAILAAGLFMIKTMNDPDTLVRILPYLFVGFGCTLFGHGLGGVLNQITLKSDATEAKQLAIDMKDERNMAIAMRAKSRAYDMMVFVYGALMIALALMGIDLAVLLLLVLVYVLGLGANSYFRYKYNKEM